MRYVALVIGLCMFFTVPCQAAEAKTVRYVYEITGEADAQGDTYNWRTLPLNVEADLPPETEAYAVFQYFFTTVTYCVPEGVRVLSVQLDEGCLTVNVSGELLQYGGNACERALITECLAAAAGLPYVERFTLMVDGRVQPLTEGRTVEDIVLR